MAKDKNKVRSEINDYIKVLNKYVRVNTVVLYGSWVNGTPSKYSDIDLAVFSEDFGKHKLKEFQLLSKLAWEIDPSIEAIPYSAEKLSDDDPTAFYNEILKKGETVYRRSF